MPSAISVRAPLVRDATAAAQAFCRRHTAWPPRSAPGAQQPPGAVAATKADHPRAVTRLAVRSRYGLGGSVVAGAATSTPKPEFEG
jgi:hypothetical protein